MPADDVFLSQTRVAPLAVHHGIDRRIGRRVQVEGVELDWHVEETRGLRRRSRTIRAQVLDLSVSGARVAAPVGSARLGQTIDVALEGGHARVHVRGIERIDDATAVYRVSFSAPDDRFTETVARLTR